MADESHNWRTTDEQEIAKRRKRAAVEPLEISNRTPGHPIFSNFEVRSASGKVYEVEIRDLAARQSSCTCADFRSNGLGTCKHIEGVLRHLESHHKLLFGFAKTTGSKRIDIVPDPAANTLRIERNADRLPKRVAALFDAGQQLIALQPEETIRVLAQSGVADLRLSQDLRPWLEERKRAAERRQLRREYETRVQSGEWPPFETLQPLFPYQREGMLHLAFTERAILADEMGLGKTVEAIAASALLHRLGNAARALILVPEAMQGEWETLLQRFTRLSARPLPAHKHARQKHYEDPPFFTVATHSQLLADFRGLGEQLRPDILILDEAQRIRNWNTPLARALKHIVARYAFVLTGSPLFDRIEQLFLMMDFINPEILGPLFRFNRDYYSLDSSGRPLAPKNLDELRQRVRPFILRRTKADVEHEVPELSERTYIVPMTPEQAHLHGDAVAALQDLFDQEGRLSAQMQRTAQTQLELVRRICNGVHALHPEVLDSPKIMELEFILEECRDNPEFRVVIFSEWEESIPLISDLCTRLGLGVAPLPKRAPKRLLPPVGDTRVYLCAGTPPSAQVLDGVHVLIHFDIPLDPALHQRRTDAVWRRGGPHLLTVIRLAAAESLEVKLLDQLGQTAELPNLRLRESFAAWSARIQELLPHLSPARVHKETESEPSSPSAEHLLIERAKATLGSALLRIEEIGSPFDLTQRRVLLVVDRMEQHAHVLDQLRADYPTLVTLNPSTHAAASELVRKGVLPPPVFPPRILLG